ncbi:GGDEF domain-containing protein [Candidatus Mycobacterium wuenschmannii]|uniref:GGDEF domain-containing protein n=1 Tax=Candidatus Mycobacterium wuenschmannii TaxID=3027808 RepID=A0ABY8VVX9_9MYCO|nr:GGDEF domain-containing protein [Candidatus Mycobacterium wuenschmannii]WIM87795.1 GGDEF domain-containing protein [Candidatus Mycobacterium wuenschmannii]
MKSESARLLRQWWDEPGDYSWVVEFYRRRGLMKALRGANVAGGVVTALGTVYLYFEDLIQPHWLSHAIVAWMVVSSVGWALYWWFFPWPSARQAALLFAFADVGVAIATGLHADPLAALSTTPLFALPGACIMFYFGARTNAAHMAFASATILSAATWLALSDRPDSIAVALAKGLVALTVAVAILPPIHFGFWLIRSNSIESLTDPLTELANRRGLANYLDRKLDTLAASSQPLCVFVIDLDGFKNINDIYGHKIGDTVIARTADQIRIAVGPSAFVARTGGEEFVVLDLLTLQSAAGIAERMRAAIEAPETPKATASIGVATGDIDTVAAFEAIHATADETMYAAKRNGGNRIALAGAIDGVAQDGVKDEIPFRPTGLTEQTEIGA